MSDTSLDHSLAGTSDGEARLEYNQPPTPPQRAYQNEGVLNRSRRLGHGRLDRLRVTNGPNVSQKLSATGSSPDRVAIETASPWTEPTTCTDNAARARSLPEKIIGRFTTYERLLKASSDTDYKMIFDNLRTEWFIYVNLLICMAGVDATIYFASGPAAGPIIPLDEATVPMVVSSFICALLGLLMSFILLLCYPDVEHMRVHGLDHWDSYFLFSISARIPAVLMNLSFIAVLCFINVIAWQQDRAVLLVVDIVAFLLIMMQHTRRIRRMFFRRNNATTNVPQNAPDLEEGMIASPVGSYAGDDDSPPPIESTSMAWEPMQPNAETLSVATPMC